MARIIIILMIMLIPAVCFAEPAKKTIFVTEKHNYSDSNIAGEMACKRICAKYTENNLLPLLAEGWKVYSKNFIRFEVKSKEPNSEIGAMEYFTGRCVCMGTEYVMGQPQQITPSTPTITSDKDTELLKKEIELLKRENDILKKENEGLTKPVVRTKKYRVSEDKSSSD